MCQERGVLVEPLRVVLFHRRPDRRVDARAPLGELGAVRHFLGEGMGEGVLRLREEGGGVEELRRHEGAERRGEIRLGKPRHAAEESLAELLPDDRRRLHDGLLALGEPVDARGEHRLHHGGHDDRVHGPLEPQGAARSDEGTGLLERADHLLDEERVAGRALPNPRSHTGERRIGAEQLAQELVGRLRAEGAERQLLVVGFLHPVRSILGPEVEHEEGARPGARLHQRRQVRVAPAVEPVEVLDERDGRLPLSAQLDRASSSVP